MIIDYSLTNYKVPTSLSDERFYIKKNNGRNGFIFILHSNVKNNIGAIHCIEKALCAWSSYLGITLKLEKNSTQYATTNALYENGKVVIYKKTTKPSGMVTVSSKAKCPNANNPQEYYNFRNNKTRIEFAPQAYKSNSELYHWNYQSSGTVPKGYGSFYNAFLHEVGHVLGLEHVIGKGYLMHYRIYIKEPQPIINLSTTGGMPVTAVNRIITDSQALEWNCIGLSDIEQLPPTIESYAINNGEPTVGGNGMVNLTNKCNVCPSHYMASESPSFSGATWQDYDAWATSGQPYNLSSGEGNKTVYFKVKNAIGTSERDDDNIYYDPDWMPSDTTGNNDPIKKERRLFIDDVNDADITISPIPCNDILHINISDFQQDYYHFEVVDMRSAIVLKGIINTPNKTIDVSRLTKGTYILRLIGKDKVYIRKLIKQ